MLGVDFIPPLRDYEFGYWFEIAGSFSHAVCTVLNALGSNVSLKLIVTGCLMYRRQCSKQQARGGGR
jgi:hypothetical protein